MAREVPELDLWDDAVLSVDVAEAIRRARAAEAAARKLDKRITNSDGAVFGRSVGASAFATSAGFSGSNRGTHVSLSRGADLRRRGRQEAQRRLLDRRRASSARCSTPRRSGVEAARRTLAKLGSRKIATCEVPVVFSPEAARGLLGQFAGRDVGRRGLAQEHLSRGARGDAGRVGAVSRSSTIRCCRAGRARGPSTARGWPSRTNVLVAGGVLRTFLCDVFAARKLGRRSTGSAGRGIGGGPHVSTSNLILRAGRTPARELERSTRGCTSPT